MQVLARQPTHTNTCTVWAHTHTCTWNQITHPYLYSLYTLLFAMNSTALYFTSTFLIPPRHSFCTFLALFHNLTCTQNIRLGPCCDYHQGAHCTNKRLLSDLVISQHDTALLCYKPIFSSPLCIKTKPEAELSSRCTLYRWPPSGSSELEQMKSLKAFFSPPNTKNPQTKMDFIHGKKKWQSMTIIWPAVTFFYHYIYL